MTVPNSVIIEVKREAARLRRSVRETQEAIQATIDKQRDLESCIVVEIEKLRELEEFLEGQQQCPFN